MSENKKKQNNKQNSAVRSYKFNNKSDNKKNNTTVNNTNISPNLNKPQNNTDLAYKYFENKKDEIRRKDRDTRHFAPANKEWNNSVYSFNKSTLYDIGAKDFMAATIIKTYFNHTPVPAIITKSKRMRDLLRRLSTRQLFASKPEIKQTNDKATVTVYTYDREKKLYTRKLYFLRRWLDKNLLGKKFKFKKLRDNIITKFTSFSKISKRKLMRKRRLTPPLYHLFSFRKRRFLKKWRISKYRVKSNLYRKTALMLAKKQKFLINVFLFNVLERILQRVFSIRVRILPITDRYVFKKVKISKKVKINKTWIIKKKWVIKRVPLQFANLILEKKEAKKEKKQRHKHNRENEIKIPRKETYKREIVLRKNYFNLQTLKNINVIILRWLMISRSLPLNRLFKTYNKLKREYKKVFKEKMLKREMLIIRYISKLYLNKFKFHSYLPALKSLLSKIYDKKIQLNIVNLKYLHLNSEMFTEAISIKLKKRTRSVIKLLRKSFNLVKTFKPKHNFITLQKQKNFPTRNVFTYFGRFNVINGAIINKVFKTMFKNNKSATILKKISKKDLEVPMYKKRSILKYTPLNKQNWKTTIRGILKSIKYKWVTGARVEASGRLTRRYAAARASYKYKHRGTLRNLEYLRNIENDLQSPSIHMLRGDIRPNSQYSLIHSKRRIGAFGVKGWISNS